MIIGSKFYHKRKCHNSMEWTKSEIENAPDGAIFFADEHEVTRGRQGRTWRTYPGQLIITILLKPANLPEIEDNDLSLRFNQLSMAISLGILEPLKAYGINLKWPNDFVFKGKKIGGVLAETVWSGKKPQGVVFGFALNVNNVFEKSDELYKTSTSLKTVFKDQINENLLFRNLMENIDLFYKKWIDTRYSYIYKLWKRNQYYLGKQIAIHNKDGSLMQGLFLDLLPNGDMVLKDGDKEKLISFCMVENLE